MAKKDNKRVIASPIGRKLWPNDYYLEDEISRNNIKAMKFGPTYINSMIKYDEYLTR